MTNKIILKRLKLHNTIWHPESGLVFRSEKIKKVIGKFEDDEIIIPDNFSELCNLWKFKIDETIFENNQTEDDDDEEEHQQSEGEDTNANDTPKHSESEDDQVQESEPEQETDNEDDEDENEIDIQQIKNSNSNLDFTEMRNQLSSFSKLLEHQISDMEQKMADLQNRNKTLHCEIGNVKLENEKLKIKFETIKNIFK